MMNILLTILSAIGYLLAFVVLLVLTALLLVLLVPIRYEGSVSYKKKVLRAHAGISWLFRLVQILFDFKAGRGLLRIRLLGRNLLKRTFGGNKKKQETAAAPEQAGTAGDGGVSESKAEAVGVELAEGRKESPAQTPTQAARSEPEPEAPASASHEAPVYESEPAAAPGEESVAVEEEENKLAAWKQKYCAAKAFLEDLENQRTLRLLLASLKSVLRHLLPTHFELKGTLGFSDPALTGRIIGLIYALQAIYGDNIQVTACFEESIIEGEMRLKGRIRLGTLVVIAVRVLLNRNFRRLLRKLKEGKNG